jgi:preprotein translocase subunit SecF
MVLVAFLIMGGGVVREFALAMFIGVITGTFSSIYVASPILLAWPEKRAAGPRRAANPASAATPAAEQEADSGKGGGKRRRQRSKKAEAATGS